ncbi:carbonic anhydrase, partial [Dysgonomonas sp. GY617]|uniref:carbonic anhydrase n=1 Tax=Dysgonomonas sp. GY617 TaxID=2780420 RepID=UPI0018847D8B
VSGKLAHIHQDSLRVKELAEGQHPRVVVICCSDSRVTPEIVFDQGLGDIFTIRTAGNVMSDYEEGSIEYAVEHTGAKLVVVLGHTSCGAINAMLDTKKGGTVPGHISSIVDALNAEIEEKDALEKGGEELPYNAVKANVEHGIRQLRNSEPILSEMNEEGKIKIVGAIYHIENGKVEFLDI